ncbi:5'-methylthioadenosine/S-adenosylhomocysteine nucleosidase [Nodosilinea sp. LEGE 07298]|uniref:5'-methylthioadenosine/S-adenosylhomocysteine nucleosidase family protein n=1 Tax=Nodosilinea sp. LEGE 07298 TaxID=2777970 RepID=UPI00187F46BA|nr:5'-methylthioadenosine/S-adenosylhomocysteine nucleosidase [Nodosilinea sp. LEGE 07298]MBE9113605.1 5'-methylthioadenosine/S-adenosylhomocysteine nucleosidase [Nodosilinea sp. LEGE 07298]
MSQLAQDITGTKSLRHTGRSPTLQAEEPVLHRTSLVREMEPGLVPPRVVILTALAEEFLAVEKYVPEHKELIHPDDKAVYEYGRFTSGGAVWDVLIVETGKGNINAADETQRAIAFFKPDVVLFVGIAGGRKGVSIGDVVASEKIYNYESGRDEIEFRPRPEVERPSYKLEQRARAVVRSWIRHKREPGNEDLPNAFVGAIAAGESVVASTESRTAQRLTQNYGDALAVEMEGYGFMRVAKRVQGVSALVIRGISDLIDGKEAADQQGSQTLAAGNASAFAFELLAKLEGAAPLTEVAKHTDSVTFDPDQTLPHHLTSLSIEAINGGEYYLRAHHGRQDFIETGEFAPPLMQLPMLIEVEGSYENVVGAIDTCNEALKSTETCPIGRFLRWLPHQTSDTPQPACLTIDDRTNLGIPWELLEVDERPLGIALQTIRSCPDIPDVDTVEPFCQGGVLAYASASVQAWQTAYSFQCHAEFREFLGQLQTSKADYGLVYIDGLGLPVALQHNPTAFIRRSNLFKSRASLVFVNGQLSFDESLSLGCIPVM